MGSLRPPPPPPPCLLLGGMYTPLDFSVGGGSDDSVMKINHICVHGAELYVNYIMKPREPQLSSYTGLLLYLLLLLE